MIRYCILCTPRSGGTSLEDSIYESFYYKKSMKIDTVPMKFQEYFHPKIVIWNDRHDNSFKLNSELNSPDRIEFYNKISELISTNTNSITMRIFPLPMYDDIKFNLYERLMFLNDNKFKFIHLNRNFNDRLISLTVSKKTNFWHRSRYSKNNVNVSKNNKIILDLNDVAKNYNDLKMIDWNLNKILKKINYILINYETMLEDCRLNKIEVVTDHESLKMYDDPYSEIVENYHEVIDFIEHYHNG
jgi:hypothetical protein